MNNEVRTPPPGVYLDVPFGEYLSWDAISNSRINLARRSLAHFKDQIPLEPSQPLRLGQLVHCGRLEPMALAKRYAVIPRFEDDEENLTRNGERPASPKTTAYYRLKVKDFEELNRDKDIVTEGQFDLMLGVVKSLSRDERAMDWLGCDGPVEVSLVWEDTETGLLCKARLDKATSDWTAVIDLKTTRDAMTFGKAIATFGYHRQMAHYRNGVRQLKHVTPFTVLSAVETCPPYGCRTAPLSAEALEVGESEVAETLRAIADAKSSGEWPCYDNPTSWCLPAWYGSGEAIELTVGGETIQI